MDFVLSYRVVASRVLVGGLELSRGDEVTLEQLKGMGEKLRRSGCLVPHRRGQAQPAIVVERQIELR